MELIASINALKCIMENVFGSSKVRKTGSRVYAQSESDWLHVGFRLPECVRTMSRHEMDCYNSAAGNTVFEIVGWDERHPKAMNKSIFEALKDNGFREATNYTHTEWGSWKFIIENDDELFYMMYVVCEVIDKRN